MGPAAFDAIPMATANLLDFADTPQELKHTWLSLLALPGGLLTQSMDGVNRKIFYVLGATQHGVLGWPCRAVRRGEDIVINLDVSPEATWVQLIVTEKTLEDFKSSELMVGSPAWCRMRFEGADLASAIALIALKEAGGRLVNHAARHGFRTLTVPYLKKLYRFLAVPHKGAMPSTEAALATALVKHVYPEKSADEIKAMVDKRYATRRPPVETVIQCDDVEHVKDVFDADEGKDVEHELRDIIQNKTIRGQPGSGALGGRKGAPAKAVMKEIEIDGELTQEKAKEFLPIVKGCKISKDTKLHMRWSILYPKKEPPHGTSRAIGIEGDREAMLFCIRWAWTEHFLQTGEPAPFEL